MAFDYETRLRLRRTFGVVAPVAMLGLAAWCYQGFPTPAAPPEPAPQEAMREAAPVPSGPAVTGLPDGPGTTEPGIYVSATPTADGTLDVSEVVWLPEPAEEVTLRTRDVASAGPVFAGSTVVASMVRLTVNGEAVRLESAEVAAPQQVAFSSPVQRFEVRYLLTGATVLSVPSTTGRGSAALGPLTGTGSDLPVVVWTYGGAVRNIQCPLLLPEMQGCAAGDPAALRTLPGLRTPTALVVLQVDLPSPS